MPLPYETSAFFYTLWHPRDARRLAGKPLCCALSEILFQKLPFSQHIFSLSGIVHPFNFCYNVRKCYYMDVCIVKYGIWNVSEPGVHAVNALVSGGYAPLAAMVLASRGIQNLPQAHNYLDCCAPLPDPFLMTDMDLAAGRVGLAMAQGEKIAVFGDYDVDGITATCLLSDFLRRHGADVVSYIPGRLEEGYGLNPIAIHQLHGEGVKLIITVDCGITAVAEAPLWTPTAPTGAIPIRTCPVWAWPSSWLPPSAATRRRSWRTTRTWCVWAPWRT